MKTNSLSLQAIALTALLACGTVACIGQTATPRTFDNSPGGLRTVAFRDSAEAKMLRDAYVILATGDHDYDGHRVGAMGHVRAAADLLGLDVSGDGKGEKSQALSNERLREAKQLIAQVLDSAEVKGQERVVKHLEGSVHEINQALGIK
jgi:hypothetical protein